MALRVARICSGSQNGRLDIQSALEQRARRLVSVPEGTFSPSPLPALLDSLTDEQLVVASDAIAAAATAAAAEQVQPPPSGKALLRLLAWLLRSGRRSGRDGAAQQGGGERRGQAPRLPGDARAAVARGRDRAG
jgi:hypothetical protein